MKKIVWVILIFVLFVLISIPTFKFILFSNNNYYVNKPFLIEFDDNLTSSNLYPPNNLKIEERGFDFVSFSWDFDERELNIPQGSFWEYAVISGFRIYRNGFWYTDIAKDKYFFEDLTAPATVLGISLNFKSRNNFFWRFFK